MPEALYHITFEAEWEARRKDSYVPHALVHEGFIHFSTAHQLIPTANSVFADSDDLLVLVVDQEDFGTDLVYENLEGGPKRFPHLYCTLLFSNVLGTFFLWRGQDGLFIL